MVGECWKINCVGTISEYFSDYFKFSLEHWISNNVLIWIDENYVSLSTSSYTEINRPDICFLVTRKATRSHFEKS